MTENEMKEIKEEGNQWEEIKDADLFEFKKEGDSIEGQLISTENNVGIHKSKMHSLKQSNGKMIKIWGSKILDDKLMSITFGTQIKIVYEGDIQPDKGNAYHDFKVYKQNQKGEA